MVTQRGKGARASVEQGADAARNALTRWVPDDREAVSFELSTRADWNEQIDWYTSDGRCKPMGSPQLGRIFEIARDHKARYVLVELRYIDKDWRAEHAAYYTTRYNRYPDVTHRMHFFTREVPDTLDVKDMQDAYCGYVVLRPLPSAPVGRTMIKPPAALAEGYRVEAKEKVDVLGRPLTITAMPFMSQDGQYTRCAHAAAWMLLQQAALAYGFPRRLPSDVHDAMMGGVIIDRQVPSEGLSPEQLLGGLTTLGLSPKVTGAPTKPEDGAAGGGDPMFPLLCQQVNTNLPAIVVGDEHAWLVTAYTREKSRHSKDVTLYVHDDALGPYLVVDTPWPTDAARARRPKAAAAAARQWDKIILPLPPKFYMTADRAEARAEHDIDDRIKLLRSQKRKDDPLALAHAKGTLRYHTYGIRSSDYKHGIEARPVFNSGLATFFRRLPMPLFLWVVEAYDTSLDPEAAVVAQVLIDPTSVREPTRLESGILATHFPGKVRADAPEYGTKWRPPAPETPFSTGRPPNAWGQST